MEFTIVYNQIQRIFNVDVPITDICNLNCAGCLSFSSLSTKCGNIDIQSTVKSIKTLIDKGCVPVSITLSGGEPLLYPHLKELIHKIRLIYSGEIHILTNGILLEKRLDDILEVDEVLFSVYPGLKYNKQILLLKSLGIRYKIHCRKKDHFINLGLSNKNLSNANKVFKEKCFLNCLSLKDNKLFCCRITSNVHILNEYFKTNFEIKNGDYLDIDKINSTEDIFKFIDNVHPFCSYCNFNSTIKWGKSKKLAQEWIFKS